MGTCVPLECWHTTHPTQDQVSKYLQTQQMVLLEPQNTIPILKERYVYLIRAKIQPNSQVLRAHTAWMAGVFMSLE